MTAFNELLAGMCRGRAWSGMNDNDGARELMWNVYDERCHSAAHHKGKYQVRANLKGDASNAAYAAWITAENPSSGAFQGTSFTWFPGEGGSVAVLCIGTDGFGQDTHILGRPGHRRRLKALSRLHPGKLWVKPSLLDNTSAVPKAVTEAWPEIGAALKQYEKVIYAGIAVRSKDDAEAVQDLIDLFFEEHDTPLTGKAGDRWKVTQTAIASELFPRVQEDDVLELLRERRFVILEGPPGTGKTRLAYRLADQVGSSTRIQFHPARTYEDFVVGLHPRPSEDGLAFEVRPGDLLRANRKAQDAPHALIIDEINRADLARVLGEAVVLFEAGESDRTVTLPYTPNGWDEEFRLAPNLLVLGTRNTSDRSIARMDLAIRRRFAFVEMWPDLRVVEEQGVDWARELFHDTLMTFAEYADDEVMRLVPGHAYLLDPRGDLGEAGREARIARRVRLELLPLLRDYLDERLVGAAVEQVTGLLERIENRIAGYS
ncbi:MAG: AAA family ATPase [Myxococcales bacterium]|jgi:5-methylcytosine-specific restriction protein B